MKNAKVYITATLLGGMAAGGVLLAGGALSKPDGALVRRVRSIEAHASQAGHFDSVIVGDSLVEQAYIPAFCGGTVLNAGLSGARVDDLQNFAPGLLRHATPKRVVIMAGVNNARHKGNLDGFRESYSSLVDAAKASGATVFVSTAGPTVPGDKVFDRSKIAHVNEIIVDVAKAKGVGVVDINSALSGRDGWLPREYSSSGPHLTPAGYLRWRGALDRMC